jgi:hypothetical protein
MESNPALMNIMVSTLTTNLELNRSVLDIRYYLIIYSLMISITGTVKLSVAG